jgi:hypothetical protein
MSNPTLRVLKLVSGEEIIGVVRDGVFEASEDENYTLDNLLFVSNPMKIVTDYDPTSKVHALYLVDWVPAIRDSTLPIDKQRVITLGDPNKDLEHHYVEIVMAEKMYDKILQEVGEERRREEQGSDNDDGDDSEKSKLANKLKKHKFDDDDIQ